MLAARRFRERAGILGAATDTPLDALTRACLVELAVGSGWPPGAPGGAARAWPLWPLARRLARLAAAYDAQVAARGLPLASRDLLRQVVGEAWVAGAARVPREGPLLVAANHPGLSDALALFAALERPDLRVVAADRPFLRALPHLARHLIYIPADDAGRRDAARAVVAHLRAGGAVLTFPAGQIEPDPALHPEAHAALARWSPSIGLFLRQVPATRVVPAIVSGVLSPGAAHHPLVRLRRQPRDREWLAALLQVFVPAYQRVCVRLALGPPLRVADLAPPGAGAAAIAQAIIAAAQRLLAAPPTDWHPLATRP